MYRRKTGGLIMVYQVINKGGALLSEREKQMVATWRDALSASSHANLIWETIYKKIAPTMTRSQLERIFEDHLKKPTEDYYKQRPNAEDYIGKQMCDGNVRWWGERRWKTMTRNKKSYLLAHAKDAHKIKPQNRIHDKIEKKPEDWLDARIADGPDMIEEGVEDTFRTLVTRFGVEKIKPIFERVIARAK
jgi:hypothetical protein